MGNREDAGAIGPAVAEAPCRAHEGRCIWAPLPDPSDDAAHANYDPEPASADALVFSRLSTIAITLRSSFSQPVSWAICFEAFA